MTAQGKVFGLVLAGGKSRRMGSDKALLRHDDGSTQLSRAVALLQRHLDRVFVSARPDQADDPERQRYEQITDRYQGVGPVAGILSALEGFPGVSWLVLACDLPKVDDATVRQLLQAHTGARPFTAFRSSYDGLPEPLCAIYAPDALPIVRKSVDEGVVCPRKILINSDTRLLEQPHPGALDNVNTPEDLARTGMKAAS